MLKTKKSKYVLSAFPTTRIATQTFLNFVNDVTNISIPLCIASKAITLPATELPW